MSALKWCLAGLASALLGCGCVSITRHEAQPATHAAASPELLPFQRTQTRGQIRVTLTSVGRTTRFVHQPDEDHGRLYLGGVPGGVGTVARAVPCVEFEFVVEYLTDVAPERRTHGSQSVLVNGGEIDVSSAAARLPPQSGVTAEMRHFRAGTAGFPQVEQPDQAVYRRLIIWGLEGARRVDVGIEEGVDGRVERFLFENVPPPA